MNKSTNNITYLKQREDIVEKRGLSRVTVSGYTRGREKVKKK